MSKRSTKSSADDTAFLAQYRSIARRIVRLAREVAVDKVLNPLLRRPYLVPRILSDMPGAAALTDALAALAKQRASSTLDSRAVDRRVRAILRETFSDPDTKSTLRVFEGQLPPPSSATQTLSVDPKRSRGFGFIQMDDDAIDIPGPWLKRAPGMTAGGNAWVKNLDSTAEHEAPAQEALGTKRPPLPRTGGDPAPGRWVSAEIEDHPPNEPLDPTKSYTVAFGIDTAQRASATATARFADELLFPKGVDEVALTVQLDSDDFAISDRTRPLRVPRSGQSRGKARFDITPRRTGRCTLKATLHKDGNFVQQLEITVSVGGAIAKPVEIEAIGRPPTATVVLQPRDIGLSIVPSASGGYDCTVWGAVAATAHLPIQQAELGGAIDALRLELMTVVMQRDESGTFVFQNAIDIAAPSAAVALRTMANAGERLLSSLFYHPAAGPDANLLGDWLRKMATKRTTRLNIQIVARTTPIPWGLLYMGGVRDSDALDWDMFLGMRHVVEQIPLQTTLSIADCTIPSDKPLLAVSVNFNTGIDTEFGLPLVKGQTDYWATAAKYRRRLRVTPRTTSKELTDALADTTTDDQIVYFYCHARSVGIGAGTGGPGKSSLVLTDQAVTLNDLGRNAPTTVQLRGMPLVFINACESADLSPAFYDGFVPYFMAKGARGVVGTECKTPALFAAEWHNRFFDCFLDGMPIGETFLTLRRDFQQRHNNPLGLLYAVHCDADTRILPALTAPIA